MIRASPHSLRRRLLGWLLASTAVIGLAALSDTWREAQETANALADRLLAGSALVIAERITVSASGALEVDIPYGALEMLSSAAQDRVFYRIDGPPGTFLTGYDTLPLLPPGPDISFADAEFGGEPVRIAALYRTTSTGVTPIPFVVTMAETTNARRQLTQTILLRSALRLLAMIAGAAVIVWISVTVSLRPLYQLGSAIATRSIDDLRPIDQTAPAEVRGLVDIVNSFMRRLADARESLRHFTGNASHQLRTPLTVVRTELALAARAPNLAEAREATAKADAALAHADRVLGQLLLLARIDAAGHAPATVPVDLVALARDLTADLVPAAAEAGIDLGFDGASQAWVAAEPVLLGELLRNLIGNAIAYAGAGALATVQVRADAGSVLLRVEDDGPGIPPAQRAAVGQRFARGNQGHTPGLGLGLPITAEIAALFGAELTLTGAGSGRGLRADLRFAALDRGSPRDRGPAPS